MTSVQVIFTPARENLIYFQNERENVIRICRDITSYSKKIIFSLHRIPPSKEISKQIKDQIESYLDKIGQGFHIIQFKVSESENFNNYKSTISNAIEEFIESITFGFYLMNDEIPSFSQLIHLTKCLVVCSITDSGGLSKNDKVMNYCLWYFLSKNGNYIEIKDSEFEIPQSMNFEIEFILEGDYLMGLFDLSGEIMRYSITHMSPENNDESPVSKTTLRNLKTLKELWNRYNELFNQFPSFNVNRGLFNTEYNSKGCNSISKKMLTLEQSVKKVEDIICGIYIRGKEVVDFDVET